MTSYLNLIRSKQFKYLNYQNREEIKLMGGEIQRTIHYFLGQKQLNKSIINILLMKDDTVLIMKIVIIIETPTVRS